MADTVCMLKDTFNSLHVILLLTSQKLIVFLLLQGVRFESKWHQSKSFNVSARASSETDKLTHNKNQTKYMLKVTIVQSDNLYCMAQRPFQRYFMLCTLAVPNIMHLWHRLLVRRSKLFKEQFKVMPLHD